MSDASAATEATTTTDATAFSDLAGGNAEGADQAGADSTKTEGEQGGKDAFADLAGNEGDSSDGGDSKSEGKEGDDKGADEGAPEKYELSAPEGMTLDDELVAVADPVFRELGLTNAEANQLLPLAAELVKRQQARDVASWTAQTKQWADDIRGDTEFGGKALGAHVARAQEAMKRFGDAQLSDDLVKFGFANHPGLFKFFARVGKAMSEDQPNTQGTESGGRVPTAELFYGKS